MRSALSLGSPLARNSRSSCDWQVLDGLSIPKLRGFDPATLVSRVHAALLPSASELLLAINVRRGDENIIGQLGETESIHRRVTAVAAGATFGFGDAVEESEEGHSFYSSEGAYDAYAYPPSPPTPIPSLPWPTRSLGPLYRAIDPPTDAPAHFAHTCTHPYPCCAAMRLAAETSIALPHCRSGTTTRCWASRWAP